MKIISFLNKKFNILQDHAVSFPYMKYNVAYKCIFIHIPKTAGTSILHALGYNGGRHHCSFLYYKMSDYGKFNKYFKFSVVRNPFDRLVSSYIYLKNGGNKKEDLFFVDLFRDKDFDFRSFVLDFIDTDIIHEVKVLTPQYLYIYDFKMEINIDYLARFESINSDFKNICNAIGLKSKKLDIINRSRSDNFKKYYNDIDVVKKVAALYKRDFTLFDYPLTI